MIPFFIPGYYLFYSRLKRKSEIVSLLIIYPIYILVMLFYFSDLALTELLLFFVVAWLAWITVYETGYFENDAITIKKEVNPTLRMAPDQITWVQQNFILIHVVRFFLAFCFLGLLFWLSDTIITINDFIGFVICIFVARLFFFFHNSLRSRWNILTYLLLSSTKYLSFFILFYSHLSFVPEILYCVLLTFPIPRTIEHAAKTKYGLQKIQNLVGNIDTFRWKYYLTGFLIALVLHYIKINPITIAFLFSMGYFLSFRLFSVLIINLGFYKRSFSKAHKK